MPATNKRLLIEDDWKNVVIYLRRDLPRIWTEEVKKHFSDIKNKAGRIIFILKQLLIFYSTTPEKYGIEISELRGLISILKEASDENAEQLINSSLFEKIFGERERKFFESLLQGKGVAAVPATISEETLDLKPVNFGGRILWVPSITQTVKLKSAARKMLISAMLVPILLGSIPTKVSPAIARLRSPEEITKILMPYAKKDEIKQLLQASAFVDELTKIIEQHKMGSIKQEDLPDYIKELISDSVLDIAVFVGAELEPFVKIYKPEIRFVRFAQSNLILRLRYVDNIKDAKKAFEDSDVIYVSAHSRYGLGWALSKEGMGNPLKMQTAPIKIPKSELHGYKGRVLKDLGEEVIVQTSDEDIKEIRPRKGYQLITMASCESGKYFLEVMKRLRQGQPTTIIYTKNDIESSPFKILLSGILTGKNVEQITQEMNNLEESLDVGYPNSYEAIVLNAEAGSPESKAYDKNNFPKSLTLFYDMES